MALDIKIEGLDGLLARLKAFPVEMAKNGGPIRSALFQGAKLIREEAKLNVQRIVDEPNKNGLDSRSTGALKQNIVAVRARNPKAISSGATEVYRVRIKRNAKRRTNNKANVRKGIAGQVYYNEISFYGRFLEFGTQNIKAYSWLRNAAATKQSAAIAAIALHLRKGIERIEKKLGVLKR